jgi:hypothetical protein
MHDRYAPGNIDYEVCVTRALKGSECRAVIKQAIALRRLLEPWFASVSDERVDSFVIVLRVDGSLGSFGVAGTENVVIVGRVLQCDLVIKDHSWGNLTNDQIGKILRDEVLLSVEQCFDEYHVAYDRNMLRTMIGTCE